MFRRVGILIFAVAVCAIVLTGCSIRVGDFTVMSTKNADMGAKYVKTGRFEATDDAWIIIFIPTGAPNMKECTDMLIEAGGGTIATDVVIDQFRWYFLIGRMGFSMEGDVWKPATMGDLQSGKEIYELTVSPDGKQYLTSVNNPSDRASITTPEELEQQYAALGL